MNQSENQSRNNTSALALRGDRSSDAEVEFQRRPRGILVIDDHRLMRRAMEEGLRQGSFTVWAAADGGEAVDLYRRFWAQIDVVLSDVEMPVLNGPETLDALREINPAVCCCFMTGDTRQSTLANLTRRGAVRVFAKPFPSVAGVVEELRELAAFPPEFSARPEPVDDPGLSPPAPVDAPAASNYPAQEPAGGVSGRRQRR